MTKAELLNFLEPFTDDVVLYVWSDEQGVWRPLDPLAQYSARSARINIWCHPRPKKESGAEKEQP